MDSTSQEIFSTLQLKILPCAKASSLRLLLAEPPFVGAEKIPISSHAETTITKPEQYPFSMHPTRWPQLGLHASRYPVWGCVIEGEADIAFGILSSDSIGKNTSSRPGDCITTVAVSPLDCFLVPPGVPYTDASFPHWRRNSPEKAYSRIFWLRAMPMGAMLQISRTQNAQLIETPAVLVKDSQLLTIAKVLQSSAEHQWQNREVVTSCLLTLLLSLYENMKQRHTTASNPWVETRDSSDDIRGHELRSASGAAITKRACDYIHSNLSDASLSLTLVARYTYVSPPHLERLFRSELKTSVMKHVTRGRINEAQSLLLETDISVQEIAGLCGFKHRTHFSRTFAQYVGISPREFRQQKQYIVSIKRNNERRSVRKRDLRKRQHNS